MTDPRLSLEDWINTDGVVVGLSDMSGKAYAVALAGIRMSAGEIAPRLGVSRRQAQRYARMDAVPLRVAEIVRRLERKWSANAYLVANLGDPISLDAVPEDLTSESWAAVIWQANSDRIEAGLPPRTII